ncbi:MAG: TFIIB-type zinc ribbon-containing protein [Asgard group archaeon]|nr:TFIIB-type zinc ribbon-containing protein [Asgard group archaeon]
MTKTSQAEGKLKSSRVVFVSKATTWAFFLYAPLVSFILSIIVLPGHVILLPYYCIAIAIRGKAPNFLSKWVQFNSRGLYRVKTIKGDTCKGFWCLYYIYAGYIIAFVFWNLGITFASLIFPVLLIIEEWRVITNFIYRLTFGYRGTIINDEKETTSKDPKTKSKVITEDVVKEKVKKKKKLTSCPVCGEDLGTETTYCPKCGSLIEG